MDNQTLINLGLGMIMTVAGWFARELWSAISVLRSEIRSIEIDLPSNYVKRQDMEARFDKIDLALSKIYEKIDRKQDRSK